MIEPQRLVCLPRGTSTLGPITQTMNPIFGIPGAWRSGRLFSQLIPYVGVSFDRHRFGSCGPRGRTVGSLLMIRRRHHAFCRHRPEQYCLSGWQSSKFQVEPHTGHERAQGSRPASFADRLTSRAAALRHAGEQNWASRLLSSGMRPEHRLHNAVATSLTVVVVLDCCDPRSGDVPWGERRSP